MSVTLLTGVPGAGKSYHAVNQIVDLLKSDADFRILTNIEGLNLEDSRLITVNWSTEDFRYSQQVQYLDQHRGGNNELHVYYFIDEAQRFFPSQLKDQDILYFFEYHRHLGLDICVITQHNKKISYGVAALCDEEIRAVSQMVNPFPGRFFYKRLAGGEYFGKLSLKKKDEVFKAYRSFDAGAGKSKTSYKFPALVAGLLFLFVVAYFLGMKALSGIGGDEEQLEHIPIAQTETETVGEHSQVSLDERQQDAIDLEKYEVIPDMQGHRSKPVGVPIPDYYFADNDTLGFELAHHIKTVSVVDYLEQYPPTFHGYGYFHMVNDTFFLLDRNGQDFIFPDDKVMDVAYSQDRDFSSDREYNTRYVDLLDDLKFERFQDQVRQGNIQFYEN